MIPLADENPVRHVPIMTILVIAACCLVFFLVQPNGRTVWHDMGLRQTEATDLRFSLKWAAIPCEMKEGRPLDVVEIAQTFGRGKTSSCNADGGRSIRLEPDKHVFLAVLVSIFLHANVAHLVGNMLFLWVFGNNIEDRRGRLTFLGFYLVGGIVATAGHYALNPESTVPIIGASGAIAAVMGAYLVWFPEARIKTVIVVGPVFLRKMKAKWLLIAWFLSQFLVTGADVAWGAHIAGFVFGVLAGWLWRQRDRAVPLPSPIESVGA
ncbi:MAG: putative rane protein [Acidimicrobiia bacterium]|nr:putative rane protein [Acidimicrobiia bacterium]